MIIQDLEQGSPEWLSFRKNMVMASDAAIILGQSPFCTPYKLWQEKLGLIECQVDNKKMAEGRKNEPIARDWFNQAHTAFMTPIVAQSSQHIYLGASCDGISTCGKYLLEIKSGESAHKQACQGIIPNYYKIQMQMQMFVTGARKCFYLSFYNDEKIIIEVDYDEEFCELNVFQLYDFWKKLTYYEAPALTKADYRDKSDNEMWNTYSQLYRILDAEIKAKEKSKENMRKELIKLCDNENSMGNGIKIQQTVSKGRVDYDSIEILKQIDLDKHRGAPITSWRVYVE